MSDVLTRFHFHDKDVTVERVQDVEDILEHNKTLRDQPQTNTDGMKHKWSVPNVVYEQLFIEYNKGRDPPDLQMFGPEFSAWADKRITSDPDLKKFLVTDPSNSFRMGWGD